MNKSRVVVLVGVLIAVVAVIVLFVLTRDSDTQDEVEVASFKECVAAGFEILETDPQECRTDDGQSFTEESSVPTHEPTDEAPSTEHASEKGVVMSIDSPLLGELVTSPLAITGSVPGSWSFEASFGIEVLDANGEHLGEGFAVLGGEEGEWMTENMVPFESTVEFTSSPTETGTLVLHKANPSDDRSRDDRVEIPIRFRE